MDFMSIVLILILLVLPIIFLKNKYGHSKQFIDKFDRIPGPKCIPFLGNLMDLVSLKREDLMDYEYNLFKTYGPVVKFWIFNIPGISVYSPESCEAVLNGMKHLEKSLIYMTLHDWLGEGLLTSKGAKWQKHRKMITPTFHFKILENFQEVMVEKSNILIKCLKKASANGQEFNIFPYITNVTLDIICETAMGTDMETQENPQSDYVSAIYKVSEMVIQRALKPWLLIDFINRISSVGKQSAEALKVLHGFTERVIKERKGTRKISGLKTPTVEDFDQDLGKKKRVAFLDLLLDVADKDRTLTDKDIREEVDTFMFEGHDTTTSGINWTIYLLGRYPEIQQRAYEELQDIFNGEDRAINVNDLAQMKYLERVIKESMRLFPPVPVFGRKLDEDVFVDGLTLPAGSDVSVNTYTLHRNPKSFANPLEFNPDNFLPENVKDRHPYAYVPFSAGPRNCIGQKFALYEEKTILASILRNFKITSTEKLEDIKLISELVLRPANGIQVKLQERR